MYIHLGGDFHRESKRFASEHWHCPFHHIPTIQQGSGRGYGSGSKAAVTVMAIVVVGMVKMMARSSGTGEGITVKDCSN